MDAPEGELAGDRDGRGLQREHPDPGAGHSATGPDGGAAVAGGTVRPGDIRGEVTGAQDRGENERDPDRDRGRRSPEGVMIDAMKFWLAKQLVEIGLWVGFVVVLIVLSVFLEWRRLN